jgi:hypothetical protein
MHCPLCNQHLPGLADVILCNGLAIDAELPDTFLQQGIYQPGLSFGLFPDLLQGFIGNELPCGIGVLSGQLEHILPVEVTDYHRVFFYVEWTSRVYRFPFFALDKIVPQVPHSHQGDTYREGADPPAYKAPPELAKEADHRLVLQHIHFIEEDHQRLGGCKFCPACHDGRKLTCRIYLGGKFGNHGLSKIFFSVFPQGITYGRHGPLNIGKSLGPLQTHIAGHCLFAVVNILHVGEEKGGFSGLPGAAYSGAEGRRDRWC